MRLKYWYILPLLCLLAVPLRAEPLGNAVYTARDSLAATLQTSEHRAVLEPILWPSSDFQVRVEPSVSSAETTSHEDALISFLSPKPCNRPAQADTVYLDAYFAKDSRKHPIIAPAVLIVPETDGRRLAAKALALYLQKADVHAFVLQPPGYARRDVENIRKNPHQFLVRSYQTVADARRAKDAIAVLPNVQADSVHLAGISLGGFMATITATLDNTFTNTFILLAGGDLYGVITNGRQDARKFKDTFLEAGYSLEELRETLNAVEPLRIADRLNPARTWLYTGKYDDVIPPENSEKLAKAARLPADHHRIYPINHYSGALLLPLIVQDMVQVLRPENPQEEKGEK